MLNHLATLIVYPDNRVRCITAHLKYDWRDWRYVGRGEGSAHLQVGTTPHNISGFYGSMAFLNPLRNDWPNPATQYNYDERVKDVYAIIKKYQTGEYPFE